MRKLMLLGATAAVMLSTMSTTAMAEWIAHPYENVGQWRCDYYYDGGIYFPRGPRTEQDVERGPGDGAP